VPAGRSSPFLNYFKEDEGINMTESNLSRRYGLRSVVALGVAGAAVALGGVALAGPAEAAQPAMARGLADLEAAYRALSHGLPDKAGHRVKAMALIQSAIAEVKAGMVAGSM